MNPEAQRVAIAEACGWKRTNEQWNQWSRGTDTQHHDDLPNYLSDLNAMHEAEMTLTRQQKHEYLDVLNRMQNEIARNTKDWNQLEHFWQVHATAAQRAEAFLRTLNLWDDNK